MNTEQNTDSTDTLAERALDGARRLIEPLAAVGERARRIELMARGLAFAQQAGVELGDPVARFHVTPCAEGWEVDNEVGAPAPQHFTSKRKAVDEARRLAHRARGVLITHREDGAVQAVYAYNDGSH
ncbi:MAG: DUF2188 domain-containing protein [Alphaproteobacteria bacterium]|nr:DUF2188 domain-containing protein [Alphaproteobacteria bacterium]